jgi:hypothetical protein
MMGDTICMGPISRPELLMKNTLKIKPTKMPPGIKYTARPTEPSRVIRRRRARYLRAKTTRPKDRMNFVGIMNLEAGFLSSSARTPVPPRADKVLEHSSARRMGQLG